MGKSIAESMKELSQDEKGCIKDIVSITQDNSLITKRHLIRIKSFMTYRLSQIEQLAYLLNKYIEDNDITTLFNTFVVVSKEYASEDSDFGNTLSSIFVVLYEQIRKNGFYDKEVKELLKLSGSLSTYIDTTYKEFEDNLEKIQNG
ncbi:MAG TPA: hypothetical protein P5136_02275 [Methanofastidiosum sp.]|nr:hypothetical protein [Methanofastidiosum sp.]